MKHNYEFLLSKKPQCTADFPNEQSDQFLHSIMIYAKISGAPHNRRDRSIGC